jgi:hypothetical protein
LVGKSSARAQLITLEAKIKPQASPNFTIKRILQNQAERTPEHFLKDRIIPTSRYQLCDRPERRYSSTALPA